MPDTSNSLLDFILSLLSDSEAAGEFYADPDGALKSAGLGDVCGDDVHSVLPLVLDYAPVSVKHDGGGRDHDRDEKDHKDYDRDHHGKDYDKDRDHDDHDGAVKEIHNILNNYTYNVDDRDTYVDQSVNQDIWAKGDVKQYFDNDSVIASGDGAVAAGGDVEGVITGDGNVVGDGNVTGDGNIVGDENEVGNTEIEDSFNTDNSVDVSGDGNAVGEGNTVDNSEVEVDVEVEDSFNTDNSDNSINDSFNKTETEVELENVGNDYSEDNSVNDSFNDNEIGNKEIEVEDSFNKDESVDVDVEVEESFNKIDASDDDYIDVDDTLNENAVTV
jgi:hypothetical protein